MHDGVNPIDHRKSVYPHADDMRNVKQITHFAYRDFTGEILDYNPTHNTTNTSSWRATAIIQPPLHLQHQPLTGTPWDSKFIKSMATHTPHGKMANGASPNFERKKPSKFMDSRHVLIMDKYSHVVYVSLWIAMF
jgi:hypothetical protein